MSHTGCGELNSYAKDADGGSILMKSIIMTKQIQGSCL